MIGKERSFSLVRERLAQEPALTELRLAAFANMDAYWRAYYQAIHVQHPGYMPLVATLMTQNPEKVETHIGGPVPLFFSPKPEYRQEFGMVDYREFNDHRGAIIDLLQGYINEDSLAVLLGLEAEPLLTLNRKLPLAMEHFVRIGEDDELVQACQQEIQDNPLWQSINPDFFQFSPDTLAVALRDLSNEFFALKRD